VSDAALLVLAVLCAVLALLVWRARPRPPGDKRLAAEFGLPPAGYRLLGADVGGHARPYFLEADGLRGVPDAVFEAPDELLVGDVKARHFRGTVTAYERYQMTLYVGMLRQRFPGRAVRGAIRYRDTVVPVPFDEHLYRWLLSRAPELRRCLHDRRFVADRRPG
jgi:hypothetical protein